MFCTVKLAVPLSFLAYGLDAARRGLPSLPNARSRRHTCLRLQPVTEALCRVTLGGTLFDQRDMKLL